MTTAPSRGPAPVQPDAVAQARTLAVTKGHGTENDFVLVDDRDGSLELTPALVRGLCDRHAGVGADGVIRLVGSRSLADGAGVLAEDPGATWFMDYRNADGSVAEMCGNGVRVTARFAEHLGLWDGAGELVLGTRAGVRRVRRVADPSGGAVAWYAVDMGTWSLPGGPSVAAVGMDAEVEVDGLPVSRPALSVDLGNPHTVLALVDVDELAGVDLRRAPRVLPVPPDGTNVELVVPLGESRSASGEVVGRLRMRVHERGVGETRSCGTGVCAAVVAVRTWAGADSAATWLVEVPGGTVQVRMLPGDRVELAGPAVLVAAALVELDSLSLR